MNTKTNQDRFKHYLCKIGSGQETARSLTRQESADALDLILKGVPTQAQIGAFMIAHRIKRPQPEELAGMIDTYIKLGPKLTSQEQQRRPIHFGLPFDGRTKTQPIYPLTILVLLSAGQPVILHGGTRMPVKYGVTSAELFKALGLNLEGLSIQDVEEGFWEHGLGFIYQPDHFPLADTLIKYRDEIGKRPPLASMELLWSAHLGKHLHISGFVHVPTEKRHWETLLLMGEVNAITIKGLEGSIDLPLSRSTSIGRLHEDKSTRMLLRPNDYQLKDKQIQWSDINEWSKLGLKVLNNQGSLKKSLLWNAGVYLWLSDITTNIHDGIAMAESLIRSGSTLKTLEKLIHWRKNIN